MRDRAEVRGDGSPAMFDAIAPRYDLLNRLLSLGLDGRWRRMSVDAMALGPGDLALDVAAGTCDMAMEAAGRGEATRVVAADPSRGMLRVGLRRLREAGLDGRVRACGADAESLPFPDGAFAASCIAFGIRNVPDRAAGLGEMSRVVRPGGRVVVLELARPSGSLLAPLARLWVKWVVPAMGGLISSPAAYRWLRHSMENFPEPDEFRATMERAGLRIREVRTLFPGACHLFVGETRMSRDPAASRD